MRDIWKDEAIRELELYKANMAALENVPVQIAELEAQVSCIRSPVADAVTVRGGNGAYDEQYINRIVKRDGLRERLESSKKSTNRVYNALCSLTDSEARILERRYIEQEPGAISRIAAEEDIDPRTVRNRLETALFKFSVAMHGL